MYMAPIMVNLTPLGEIMMLVSWATVISRLVRPHSGLNSLRAKRLLRSVLVKTLQLLSA